MPPEPIEHNKDDVTALIESLHQSYQQISTNFSDLNTILDPKRVGQKFDVGGPAILDFADALALAHKKITILSRTRARHPGMPVSPEDKKDIVKIFHLLETVNEAFKRLLPPREKDPSLVLRDVEEKPDISSSEADGIAKHKDTIAISEKPGESLPTKRDISKKKKQKAETPAEFSPIVQQAIGDMMTDLETYTQTAAQLLDVRITDYDLVPHQDEEKAHQPVNFTVALSTAGHTPDTSLTPRLAQEMIVIKRHRQL